MKGINGDGGDNDSDDGAGNDGGGNTLHQTLEVTVWSY